MPGRIFISYNFNDREVAHNIGVFSNQKAENAKGNRCL